MAAATVESSDIEVTLTLNREEALYVWSALLHSGPWPADRLSPDGEDTVWSALNEALIDAGVSTADAGLSYITGRVG